MTTTLLAPPLDTIVDDATRRQFLAGLAAAGLLAGCGSAEPPTPAAPSSGAFPVRVDHAFGATEIPAAPTRVVTIGVTEQDPVLALGVQPVGITEWFGEKPFAVWPWAGDELGDAEPQVLSGELTSRRSPRLS